MESNIRNDSEIWLQSQQFSRFHHWTEIFCGEMHNETATTTPSYRNFKAFRGIDSAILFPFFYQCHTVWMVRHTLVCFQFNVTDEYSSTICPHQIHLFMQSVHRKMFRNKTCRAQFSCCCWVDVRSKSELNPLEKGWKKRVAKSTHIIIISIGLKDGRERWPFFQLNYWSEKCHSIFTIKFFTDSILIKLINTHILSLSSVLGVLWTCRKALPHFLLQVEIFLIEKVEDWFLPFVKLSKM